MILDQIIALTEERAALWAATGDADRPLDARQRLTEIEDGLLPAAWARRRCELAGATDRPLSLAAYQSHLKQRRKAG
jgi:hypothetical protein